MKTFYKIITTFLIILINLTFAACAFANDNNFSKKAPDPTCPLAYFFNGYDLVKGNPASNGADPGWKGSVMVEQRNETCLDCTSSPACSANYQVYEMEGEIDYYNRLYGIVNIAQYSQGFLKSEAFSGSAEFEYQRQDVFGLGFVNIQAEGSCQLFYGLRKDGCYDVKFDPTFLTKIEEFPISTQEPDWYNKVERLFNEYGTHIIKNTNLGARWAYESLFTQADYEGLRASDINIQMAAEVSAEYKRTNGGSASYESEEQTELRLMFDGAAKNQRAIFVGALPPESPNFGEWANNIDNPIPQSFSLTPLSELLTPRMFPNDLQIELKREVMEAGYELYCDSVPGCREPIPTRIIRLSDTIEGKYQTQNSLSVACPADYLLISGGCKSEPEPYEPYYWILPSLIPVGNAYHCIASMDYWGDPYHHNYYKGVDANATCLHKDYIENVVTIPCEGAIGPYGSECSAYCPSGYQVTGGGCESNFPDDFTPWKVTISLPLSAEVSGRDGWSCKVAHNYGAEVDDRKAEGYAICVQYAEGKVADRKIVSEYSGTAGLETNGAVAVCDVGYEVVGGGCRVPSHSSPYYEWKIVESQPSRDKQGWSCLAQRDLGTNIYNQDIQTNAVCAKFN